MMLLPIPTPRPRLKEYYRDVNHSVFLSPHIPTFPRPRLTLLASILAPCFYLDHLTPSYCLSLGKDVGTGRIGLPSKGFNPQTDPPPLESHNPSPQKHSSQKNQILLSSRSCYQANNGTLLRQFALLILLKEEQALLAILEIHVCFVSLKMGYLIQLNRNSFVKIIPFLYPVLWHRQPQHLSPSFQLYALSLNEYFLSIPSVPPSIPSIWVTGIDTVRGQSELDRDPTLLHEQKISASFFGTSFPSFFEFFDPVCLSSFTLPRITEIGESEATRSQDEIDIPFTKLRTKNRCF